MAEHRGRKKRIWHDAVGSSFRVVRGGINVGRDTDTQGPGRPGRIESIFSRFLAMVSLFALFILASIVALAVLIFGIAFAVLYRIVRLFRRPDSGDAFANAWRADHGFRREPGDGTGRSGDAASSDFNGEAVQSRGASAVTIEIEAKDITDSGK